MALDMTDPGPEYRRRQSAQLTVINAIRSLIDQEPDRLSTAESGHVTIHLVGPTVRQDERLVTLLDNARVADIEVEFTESPRSLRELTAIHDETLRTDPFKGHGVRGAMFGIDPATATIGITVADSAVDLVRRVFAPYGEAVVVSGTGPVDLSTRLERHSGSRERRRRGGADRWLRPDATRGDVDELNELLDEGCERAGTCSPAARSRQGSARAAASVGRRSRRSVRGTGADPVHAGRTRELTTGKARCLLHGQGVGVGKSSASGAPWAESMM
jgi:hypothetical protein